VTIAVWPIANRCSLVATFAKRNPELRVPPHVHRGIEKTKRVSLGWVALIARIYEVNPLICTSCEEKSRSLALWTMQQRYTASSGGLGGRSRPKRLILSTTISANWFRESDDGFPVEVQIHHAVAPILPFNRAIVIHRNGTIMPIRRMTAIRFLPLGNRNSPQDRPCKQIISPIHHIILKAIQNPPSTSQESKERRHWLSRGRRGSCRHIY
jgi:hypothetical protein